MSSPDISCRGDVERLLLAFYGRAMLDALLEPVFTTGRMDLATHLPRIVSFWEVTLLHAGDYSGRPMQIHRRLVDEAGLRAIHYDRWLTIWRETVSASFSGPIADKAITEAARMGAAMARATGASKDAETLTLTRQVTALGHGRDRC